MAARKEDSRVRFFRKVAPSPSTGCWQWLGGQKGGGYAAFVAGGTNWRAHRWSYVTFIGPIPEGLELDHLCRNTLCVNPDHLEPVTRLINIQRRVTKNERKTHCPQGHEYTPENTGRQVRDYGGVSRFCKTCARETSRRNYLRDPQASHKRSALSKRRAKQSNSRPPRLTPPHHAERPPLSSRSPVQSLNDSQPSFCRSCF